MKVDQRVALTKRLLLEGLLRLLKTKNISKISVTELCAESGINRATFYRHYEQPRDIINEMRYVFSKEVKALAGKVHAEKEPKAWLEEICRYFYSNADLLKVFFSCRTDDEFVLLINEMYQDQIHIIRNHGFGKELDNDELKLTTYWFAGGIYYILRQWIIEPIDKTPEEVANVIYRFILMAK